jgi:N-methylhydantoinase B
MDTVDPITLEVMRNAFYSIADEMLAALVRTGFSTNIKDRGDCSSAIYTPEAEEVGQCAKGTPLHIGTLPACVHTVIESYQDKPLEDGDHIIMNTPFPGGPAHLNDVAMVTPVFYEDRLIAWLGNQAHHVDLGGYAPGSMPCGVTEIYQEGLQIPPVKIGKKDHIDEELMSFINANVRTKIESRGDTLAQIAANNVGKKRLLELIDNYGSKSVTFYMEELINYSERRMRAGIREMPEGVYTFEDYLDDDGITDELIKIKSTVHIKEDSILVDFTGTAPQVRGGVNCGPSTVMACVYYVALAVVDPDIPPNHGVRRPIEVIAPEGTLVNARFPTAVAHSNIVASHRIVDATLGAFAKAVPEKVLAACNGTINLFNIGAIDAKTDGFYNYIETYGGGQGACHFKDGMDGVHSHTSNTRNAPVEVIEIAYPLKVRSQMLVPDSEGAGKYRGGLGMTREIEILSENTVMTVSSDRHKIGPWGLHGGMSGGKAECQITSKDGVIKKLPSLKMTIPVNKHDVMKTKTPGGGGWGSPLERDIQKVLWDVKEGFISSERARKVYGVVIDRETLTIDARATDKLRNEILKSSE